jgi:hypothetical protein
MRTSYAVAGGALLAGLLALPALAKTDAAKKGPSLRFAHKYADAIEEAKDRGAIIFATVHIDH